MRIENDEKVDYSDVLIRPKRSTLNSRKEVSLEREFKFYHSKKVWKGVPIIASNMASCGTFEIAKTLSKYKMITAFHKFYEVNDYEKFFKTFNNPDYVCYTLGIREEDILKLKEMISKDLINNFSFVCIDVPNGYLQRFLETIKLVRKLCPNHIIIAGNVVTNEVTEEIILNGADIVKVGIGQGASCTTRLMTGVGYPQLSAVIECSDAAHGISNENGCGMIISDGGKQHPSCVAKSFCGGADFCMMGSMFSGFEESSGETVFKEGKKFKEFFGSSSNKAMKEFYGRKESYRASEGRYCLIPHKGSLEAFLQELLGSLRSTGTYIGARRLKEFSKRATFIKTRKQVTSYLFKYEEED